MSDAPEVTIEMFGDVYFRRRIQAMRYRSRNLSPVLHQIADDWIDIIEHQFETEGGRTGKKWAKLEIDTIKRRGSSHPILIDSGDMFDHLLTPDNVFVTDESITYTFETDPEIATRAEAHQYGFLNHGSPVPARPIVDFTEFDEKLFRDKIQRFLVEGDDH